MATRLVGGRLEDGHALLDQLLVARLDLVGCDQEGQLHAGRFGSAAVPVVTTLTQSQTQQHAAGVKRQAGVGFGGHRERQQVAVEGLHPLDVVAEDDRVAQ